MTLHEFVIFIYRSEMYECYEVSIDLGSDFRFWTIFAHSHARWLTFYSLRSKLRYWMASETWAGWISSDPSKSAIVRLTLRMRL